LADQLLLPMALAGGGEFTTLPVNAHFQSHALIIETFLGHHVSAIQMMVSFMRGLASKARKLTCFEICWLSLVSQLISLVHG